MTRILVTNDDGIASIGLHVLARTIRKHGDVVVVAPEVEHSGAGAGVGPLHLIKPQARTTTIEGVEEAWCVNGSPALCTMFARFGVFGPIDLVVSGINPGANVGRAVYHSGTVGAALTARNGSASGVAVSQAVAGFGVEGQGWDEMILDQHWQTAADVAAVVVAELVATPPSEPVVVNINVPNLHVDEIQRLAPRLGGGDAAAGHHVGTSRPDRRHRRLLRHPHGVRRHDPRPVRHGQRGDRTRRGGDHLPEPARCRASRRPRTRRRSARRPARQLRSRRPARHSPIVTTPIDDQLRSYRASIDNIDAALVHLLAERFKITQAVGRHKAEVGLPAMDPEREAEQVIRLRGLAAESGLDPAFTEAFLRFILDEVIRHHEDIPR